jgi:hypothetical protein
MVAVRPHRFEHVTSLVLTAHPTAVDMEYPTGIITALCTALPKLSLLSAAMCVPDADVAALAPLVPHLTSLALAADAPVTGCGIRGLVAFTALRSLALALHSWVAVRDKLQVLSSLDHLQALEWLGDEDGVASAARWLPPLRALSGLTNLMIRPALDRWDEAAVDALRAGFPELAALALALQAELDDEELAQGAISALAARTALTSLQLDITGRHSGPGDGPALPVLPAAPRHAFRDSRE